MNAYKKQIKEFEKWKNEEPGVGSKALTPRSILVIGTCYDYEAKDENDKNFIYGILSAASANSVAEKTIALGYLRSVQITIAKTTWKKIAEKAA